MHSPNPLGDSRQHLQLDVKPVESLVVRIGQPGEAVALEQPASGQLLEGLLVVRRCEKPAVTEL